MPMHFTAPALAAGLAAWLCCLAAAPAGAGNAPAEEPVAVIHLLPQGDGSQAFPLLKRAEPDQRGGILVYRGLALLERRDANPILVAHAFHTGLGRLVKVHLNWHRVAGVEVLAPDLTF